MTAQEILVIGSGGREHVLGLKLRQSLNVKKLFFAPGNGGTQSLGENIEIGAEEVDRLAGFAQGHNIGLTVVGPEGALAKRVVDTFNERSLPIFGPSREAAQLETSKVFASRFMEHHDIPHPDFHVSIDMEDALRFIQNPKWKEGMVIKADGLAAGKGVILPDTPDEAREAVIDIMQNKLFGKAGERILFQERLKGPEVSVLALSDGQTVVQLLSAQDHKRIWDHDKGPNTGGMGAYAPVPFFTPALMQEVQEKILKPTIRGMAKDGAPYKGVLYAGLMLTDKGPVALEYNARFGDPETQPLMMLLESDLAPILLACIEGTLTPDMVRFRKGASVCVVISSEGYPEKPILGDTIHGLDKISDPDIQVFQAGTIVKSGVVQTNGGRVLGVTAYGAHMQEAIRKAYSVIGPEGVHFRGMHYRTDIGKMAIKISDLK